MVKHTQTFVGLVLKGLTDFTLPSLLLSLNEIKGDYSGLFLLIWNIYLHFGWYLTLHEKCPYLEFFYCVFSCINT